MLKLTLLVLLVMQWVDTMQLVRFIIKAHKTV